MSQFCSNCGRPLAEGTICGCSQRQTTQDLLFIPEEAEVNSSTNMQQNDFKQFLMNMWSFVKMFAKNPLNSIVNSARTEDFKAGLFFVAVQALVASLTSVILINRVIKSFASLMFGSFYGLGGGIDIPYLSIFIKVILFVVVQFFLLIGLFYLGSKFIAKKTGSIKGLIAAVGISSIPMTASILASMVIGLIVPSLIFYIMILGIICGVVLNYISLRETFGIPENKAILIVPVSYCVYLFILATVFAQSAKIL